MHIPPRLTPEEIAKIKAKVQPRPFATRHPRANAFIHPSINVHLADEHFREVWEKVGAIVLNHAKENNKGKYGCERQWETIPGWFAEKAVSLWTGLPWNPTVGKYLESDVGHLQVRGSQCDSGHLLTHEEDNGEEAMVFVTNNNILNNRIRGWLWTSETKDYEQYWCTLEPGRPCFGVPLWDLRSPKTLLELLGRKL